MGGWFPQFRKYPAADFSLKHHTDLIVRCNGSEFHLHKVILSAKSEFFEKACHPDSPFMEAQTGVISLDDDDPMLIKFLLTCCYSKMEFGILDELYPKRDPEQAGLLRCIDAYSVADKYRFTGLKTDLMYHFKTILNHFIRKGPLSPSFLMKMTIKIFESTPSTDRGLRDPVLFYASKHLDSLIVHEQFKDIANSIDGFWSEVMSLNFRTRKRARECPKCKATSTTCFEDGESDAQCKKCRTWQKIDDWNRPMADLRWHHDNERSSSDEESECEASSNKRKRTEELEDEDGGPEDGDPKDGDNTGSGNVDGQNLVQ